MKVSHKIVSNSSVVSITMIQIRDAFVKHAMDQGFEKDQILIAWKKAQTTIYTDYLTLEVMTIDLLQKPKETEELIKQYKKR